MRVSYYGREGGSKSLESGLWSQETTEVDNGPPRRNCNNELANKLYLSTVATQPSCLGEKNNSIPKFTKPVLGWRLAHYSILQKKELIIPFLFVRLRGGPSHRSPECRSSHQVPPDINTSFPHPSTDTHNSRAVRRIVKSSVAREIPEPKLPQACDSNNIFISRIGARRPTSHSFLSFSTHNKCCGRSISHRASSVIPRRHLKYWQGRSWVALVVSHSFVPFALSSSTETAGMDTHKAGGGGGAGEVRRINVVYFLSRGGRTDHPHLFRVSHLHRAGVRLRGTRLFLFFFSGRSIAHAAHCNNMGVSLLVGLFVQM